METARHCLSARRGVDRHQKRPLFQQGRGLDQNRLSRQGTEPSIHPNQGEHVGHVPSQFREISGWTRRPTFGTPVQAGALQDKPSGDPGLGDQYEAEAAMLLGAATVKSDHSNYNGKGFVSNLTIPGDGVRFKVNVPTAGFHIATLRYSNGKFVAEEQQYRAKRSDAAPSHLTIYVNGQKIKRTTLDKTRNDDQWMQEAEALKLNAGVNEIEYRMDPGDEGELALDNIWLYPEPSWRQMPEALPVDLK